MFLCVLFAWGLKWRYILGGIVSAIIILPLVWVFYLDTYQQNRILTFFFPGHDESATYHITQSISAITSGGLAGSAYGMSVPVPVKESDFIYTAVSEQMGFVGTTTLIVLIVFFIGRAIMIAAQPSLRGKAESFMIVALISVMAFHFIENMGMCVGLLPITGIPLPFVSNGGPAWWLTCRWEYAQYIPMNQKVRFRNRHDMTTGRPDLTRYRVPMNFYCLF